MNNSTSKLSVLLISPRTYNYHELIVKSFERAGAECIWLDERPFSHFLFKIFSRRFNRLSRCFSARFYFRRVRSLFASGFSPTHVLVVKGEAIHSSVLNYVRKLYPQTKFTLYFWDSVVNLPGHESILSCFDTVASFDYRDCSIYGWRYCPLFSGNSGDSFKAASSIRLDHCFQYDWSFVGVVHSDRLKVIDDLIRSNSATNLRFFLYIYFPSLAHLLRYFFLSPAPFLRLCPYIHFHSLSPTLLPKIYNQSRSVLDVHHPDQSGLTMRTVESILSGLKVMTTNSFVINEPFFSPERVLILDRNQPFIPLAFLNSNYIPLPISIVQSYLPVQWVIRLLSL